MCTVSVVPVADGCRLVCSRDELIARAAALPPRRLSVGGVDATLPIDPQSGGTWIAVSGAGLVLALLNRAPAGAVGPAGERDRAAARTDRLVLHSRGEIIPRVIGGRDLRGVIRALRAIEPRLYAPFRLVAVWRGRIAVTTSDSARVRSALTRLEAPMVFTSSSLGDAAAERLRIPLFAALVARAPDPLQGQRDFHDHAWPACPAFSVRMRRPDARTVSRSTIDVRSGVASFAYEPLPTGAS
jgi:hypothetical protein